MNKKELLQSYLDGYDELTTAIKNAGNEMLYFKPAENKWSAVEVIIHLTDAEFNGNIRFRKAIAESGSKVEAYDQNAWAEHLDYQHQDMVTALALLKLLRLNNFTLLSSLKEEVWDNYIVHPERGNLTLFNLLNMYTEHLYVHIEQIERNFTAYKKQAAF